MVPIPLKRVKEFEELALECLSIGGFTLSLV